MEFKTAQNNTTAKLPILKLGEYEMWEMRIKQYFQVQDYALWEVIENGNSWLSIPQTTQENGTSVTKNSVPVTAEEKICKKNDVKARSLLLMALPNEHQLTFSQYNDAKIMYAAIKTRFGESLDSIFNRLQKLVSRLAILGVADIETMSIDDLYNNFKIVEQEVKKTIGASTSTQNLAFMTASSTSSTNNVNTGNPKVSTVSSNVNTASTKDSTANLSDATVYAFLTNQPKGSQLVHEDLEQIHDDDLEEMDLKWQLALLSMRARRFYQRTGKKITINGSDTVGFDKSKNWSQDNSKRIVNVEDTSSKAILAIDGIGFDWSDMAEEQVQTNMALMAFSDSEKNEVLFGEEITVLKREVGCKDYKISVLKTEFEKVKQEKEGIDFKIAKFNNASKNLEKLLASQITEKSKKGLGYHVVALPHPLSLNAPTKLDLSYSGLDEFKEPEFNGYGPRDTVLKSTNDCDKESDNSKENTEDSLKKEQVSDIESSSIESPLKVDKETVIDWKETVFHTAKKVEFIKPKNSEKPVEKTVRYAEMYINHKVNTVRPRVVNTASPDTAPVNIVRANEVNAVKPSACWVWRPTRPNDASLGNLQLNDKGFVDSGCSRHMTGNIAYLSNFKEFNGGRVTFRGGAYGGRISGKGTLKTDSLDFDDVYFVKELNFNLFSVSQILPDENQILLKISREDNMYSFDIKNIVSKKSLTCLLAKATLDESMLWHKRPGHINFKNINKLVKENLVRGLPLKHFENDQTCAACLKGKQHRASCKSKVLNPITKPLFMLHIDLSGPTFVSSLMHKKYCLVITDDYSKFTWIFFLATKDETSDILKKFTKEIENLVDKKVKIIRCDNGIEFKNKVMDDFCKEKGIKREYSVARTPQQNGVAERRNRTLIEAARTIGFKLALSFMKPFGCHVTILNTLDHLGKFDGKSDEGLFIGYSLSSKAFRVYNTRTKRVEENLHVGFLENKPIIEGNGLKWLFDIDSLTQSMNYVQVAAGTSSNDSAGTQGEFNTNTSTQKEQVSQDCIVMPIWEDTIYFDSPSKDISNDEPKSASDDQEQAKDGPNDENTDQDTFVNDSNPKEDNTIEPQVNTASPGVNTGSSELNTAVSPVNTDNEPEVDLGNILSSYTVPTTPNTRIHEDHPIKNVIGDEEPNKVTKVLSDPAWVEAMQEELLQFKLQKVWILVDLPKGKRPIGTKWIFKNKKDKRCIVIRNKARLVTQGYTQEEGIDYDDVFTPVARIEAIRLFLAYASFMGFMVYQMDVKSDFLYGQIEEEFYVYVDDIIFGSTNKELCNGFEKLMEEKFQMSSMGELNFFLGLQVQQKKDRIFISYDKYVDEILKKFNYPDVKSASTLVDLEKPLVKDRDATDVDAHLYRSMIRSLMYLTTSRPDIMFACKKQTVVATSKTEAEYVAAASCCGQVLWIQNQLLDYGYNFMNTMIHIDNNNLLTKGFNAGRFQYLVSREENCAHKQSRMNGRTCNIRQKGVKQFGKTKEFRTLSGKHNMVAYLEKSEGSEGFHEIIDFLNASHIKYALTKNPTIYVSFIKQFWRTATASTDANEQVKLTASIDGHVKTITEASLRRHLKLEDNDGVTSLPNSEIFKQLALMRFIQICLDMQNKHLQPYTKTYAAHSLKNKVFSNIKRALRGYSGVEVPLFPTMLNAPTTSPSRITSSPSLSPDPSPHHTSTSAPSTSQPQHSQPSPDVKELVLSPHESPLQSVCSLGRDEGSQSLYELTALCTTLSKKVEGLESDMKQTKVTYNDALTKLIKKVKKLEHIIKTSKSRRRARVVLLEDEDAQEDSSKQRRKISDIDKDPNISLVQDEEVTWFQDANTEIPEKASNDTELVLQGSGENVSTTSRQVSIADIGTASEIGSIAGIKAKDKAIRLEEQFNEEEAQRIARDAKIAKQLHEEMNKTRQESVVAKDDQAHVIDWSDPSVIRYHALKIRPRSVSEVRKNMCVYLKNQGGYKMKDFKGMSCDDIRLIFERVWDQINSFVPMHSEFESQRRLKRKSQEVQEEPAETQITKTKQVEEVVQKKSLARKKGEESAERQKLEDDVEKEELQVYLNIVIEDEGLDVESLSTKYPIVDWKTHVLTETFIYYQIIRADGSSKNYKIFSEMLYDFDRQDVLELHRLVKERLQTASPEGYDLLLWGDLKTMMEPNEEDDIWRN
ncbi:putative ribonuclease H-like domain-containing protein [Tanacetum coccineum]